MTYTEYYSRYAADSEKRSAAYTYLVDYALSRKRRGRDKLETEFDLDMESSQPAVFIPGMIYTFMYARPDEQVISDVRFTDVVPLVMVTGRPDPAHIEGLNFNLLLPEFRAAVLDIINETNPDFYDNVENDGFAMNDVLYQTLADPVRRGMFMKSVNYRLSADITSACRRYRVANCSEIRLVEYDMWKYIPFLSYGKSVRGAALSAVQRAVLQADK